MVETFEGLPGWLSMAPSSVSGDGMLMGLEIGAAAKTIHNNIALFLGFNAPSESGKSDEFSFRLSSIGEMLCPHTIVVNKSGRRFEDESFFPSMAPALRQFVTATHSYANLPCFLIFDSQFAKRFSFAGRPVGASIPHWVASGKTISEVADKLGISADDLEATATRFNTFARKGVDEDFRRGEKKWSTGHPIGREGTINPALGTIDEAPFYALELHPSAFASAGLVTNVHGQVIISAIGPSRTLRGRQRGGTHGVRRRLPSRTLARLRDDVCLPRGEAHAGRGGSNGPNEGIYDELNIDQR